MDKIYVTGAFLLFVALTMVFSPVVVSGTAASKDMKIKKTTVNEKAPTKPNLSKDRITARDKCLKEKPKLKGADLRACINSKLKRS